MDISPSKLVRSLIDEEERGEGAVWEGPVEDEDEEEGREGPPGREDGAMKDPTPPVDS